MKLEVVLSIGGSATVVSVVLSVILIQKHFAHWTQPARQRNALRIILMAPLFAVDSFVGLLELDAGETVAHALDMVKECYEAVAIHSFLMLMYDLCGLTSHVVPLKKPNRDKKKKDDDDGDGKDKAKTRTREALPDGIKGRELHLPLPVVPFFGKHAHFDHSWLDRLRFWTLQFVFLRPVLSLVDLIFVDIHPTPASTIIGLVITVVLNISVTTAVMALLTFYHAFERELAPHRPLAKFICIKGVVFFATWQGVVLKLLARLGILREEHRFSIDELELAWQDLLVCVEMGLLFAPLNLYAYNPPSPPVSRDKKELEMKKQN